MYTSAITKSCIQEDQELKVIFCYTVSLRPDWVAWASVSKVNKWVRSNRTWGLLLGCPPHWPSPCPDQTKIQLFEEITVPFTLLGDERINMENKTQSVMLASPGQGQTSLVSWLASPGSNCPLLSPDRILLKEAEPQETQANINKNHLLPSTKASVTINVLFPAESLNFLFTMVYCFLVSPLTQELWPSLTNQQWLLIQELTNVFFFPPLDRTCQFLSHKEYTQRHEIFELKESWPYKRPSFGLCQTTRAGI